MKKMVRSLVDQINSIEDLREFYLTRLVLLSIHNQSKRRDCG